MTDELFSLAQLEKKLDISERTLLRYLANGELPGVKIGREWRFTQEDIDSFIATRRQKTVIEREKKQAKDAA